MALFVIYNILCLCVILCHGTLVHKFGSCRVDACEKKQNIAALEQRILALESKETSYAFMAQTHENVTHLTQVHHMVFENVVTNVGGSYDKYNGTFVVPLSGTYAFSHNLTFKRLPGHAIRTYLKQNDRIIGNALCNVEDDYEMCEHQSVVHANVGDEIYITLSVSGDIVIQPGPMEAHYEGFLIHQD